MLMQLQTNHSLQHTALTAYTHSIIEYIQYIHSINKHTEYPTVHVHRCADTQTHSIHVGVDWVMAQVPAYTHTISNRC